MTKFWLILAAVFGLPLVVAGFVLGPTAFDIAFHRRAPERFLIPEGYTGWARVDFRQPGAAPLPIEGGRRLIKLDEHGTLRTSSDVHTGHARDEFFYYAGERRSPLSTAGVCKGGMVWQNDTIAGDGNSGPFMRFFVGPEQQFRQVFNPTGKDWPVCER